MHHLFRRLTLVLFLLVLSVCYAHAEQMDTLSVDISGGYNLVIFRSEGDSVDVWKTQQVIYDRTNHILSLPKFLGTKYTYNIKVSAVPNVSTWEPNDCYEITPLNHSFEVNNGQNYFYLWDFDADNGEGSYIQWDYIENIRAVQTYWYKAQGDDTYSYVHTFKTDEGVARITVRFFMYMYLSDGTSGWHCVDVYANGEL